MLMFNATDSAIDLTWTQDDEPCTMSVGPGAEVWVDETAPFLDQAHTLLTPLE